MRWFKHYSDNYRGRSIDKLFEEFGHCGISSYFILTELCTEKLEKNPDKTLEKADIILGFSERFVRKNLRVSSTKLKEILNICQGLGLLSYEFTDKELKINYPMLLDLLDSDHKKTRSRREQDAGKARLDIDKEEDKERDIDKEIDISTIDIVKSDFDYTHPLEIKSEVIKKEFDLELIYAEYPRKEGKKIGMDRLKKIIKSQEKFDQVLLAVRNYKKSTYGTEQKFIKQFSSFVSVWEDYLKVEEKDKIQVAKEAIQKRFDSNPFRTGGIENVN